MWNHIDKMLNQYHVAVVVIALKGVLQKKTKHYQFTRRNAH